jgi:hypothetical protein
MAAFTPECPYVGLDPFREQDAELFFGRGRESRVIAANLQYQPITVLYGASGVGKSSVLQAGVLPRLKSTGRSITVNYFRAWQNNIEVQKLLKRMIALADAGPEVCEFILLDQFEEFILYFDQKGIGKEIDRVLARLVNRGDVSSKLLIGIREDSLYALDQRLGLRIPGLLINTLQLKHLDENGAREAIERPLIVFGSMTGRDYSIEPALVDEILAKGQASASAENSVGVGRTKTAEPDSRIETVYLQLVLTHLWTEEEKKNSPTLRLQTLQQIGGAGKIIENHVTKVMASLKSKEERDIAMHLFPYLVTPSGRKIAQETNDLLNWGLAPGEQVRTVLKCLSEQSGTRILRRLAAPEKYELFHDVLASPVLEWNRRQLAMIERRASIKKWIVSISVLSVLAIAVVLGIAWNQHEQQRVQAMIASKTKDIALSLAKTQARNAGLVEALEQEAKMADRKGDNGTAAVLRHVEASLNESAEQSKKAVAQLDVLDATPDLAQQIASLTKERDSLAGQLRDAKAKLDRPTEPDQSSKQQVADLTKERDSFAGKLSTDEAIITQLKAADQTPGLTQKVAALSKEIESLKEQLKDANDKVKLGGTNWAGLYSALNDYENAFRGAFGKSTAKCQDDLNSLYQKKLSSYAPWCKDARSFDVKEEQCAVSSGSSADAPALTCTETVMIHLKDGDKPPVTSRKTFEFTKSGEAAWKVSGWH